MKATDGEFGGIGDGHDGHDTCLDGVGDDEIAGIGYAAGHVEADDEKAFGADLFDGDFDIAAHQGTGQDQDANAGQAIASANGSGQGLFADKRDGVDRDMFAADVVAVRFGDGSESYLADLSTAAHNDDPFTVDLLQGLNLGDGTHDFEGLQIGDEGLFGAGKIDFEIEARFDRAGFDDGD